jgi:hypothetical protein
VLFCLSKSSWVTPSCKVSTPAPSSMTSNHQTLTAIPPAAGTIPIQLIS